MKNYFFNTKVAIISNKGKTAPRHSWHRSKYGSRVGGQTA